MLGLMMQTPLLLSSILMHAARSFPAVEIVSRTPDKPDHITSYSGLLQRSSQLANALDSIGIKPGINDAEDVVVFFDLAFIDLVHSLIPQCPTVEGGYI